MPTLITTIEDSSPVIFYSGSGGSDWTAGTSSNDSLIDKYSDSSYTVTQVANASVSFTFTGIGVQVFAAERADHGSYQVTIDSHVYPPASGHVNGTEEVFQTQIFQSIALENELHTLTMVNLGTTKLDVDFITWETTIGHDQEPLLSFIIQDSDSSFEYTPASAWTTSPPNIGMFNGGSGHVTSTPGAFVEYTFTGAAVAIFGPVGPQGAPYSVQLDNGPPTNYSSSKQFYHPQTMLFQAGNISSGTHTVRLTSEAWNNSALTLAIDYAEVFSAPSLQPRASLAAGTIVAIIFGTLLACILAAGCLFYRHRRGMAVDSGADSGTVYPFRQGEYRPLMHSSQGQAQSQPPTPHSTMQSSNSGSPPADTASTHYSKMINPEGFIGNPPVSPRPYIPDRKYRPDITRSTSLTWQHRSDGTSSRHSLPLNALGSPDSSQLSYTTEQGGSGQTRMSGNGGTSRLGQPPGPAPPEYVRDRPQ